MELASAKAVITGGASGLGLATAETVIAAGGQVALLDVNDDQGRQSAGDLGDRAHFLRADVSSEADVQQAIAAANDAMGGITLAPAQQVSLAAGFGGGQAKQVTASLVSEVTAVASGESFRVAVRLDHQEHWHTYGKVLPEGVIGKPTKLQFTAPEG